MEPDMLRARARTATSALVTAYRRYRAARTRTGANRALRHLPGTGYQYFKYYMLVRYLLEHDKLGVDALVDRDFDIQSLEQRVLDSLGAASR